MNSTKPKHFSNILSEIFESFYPLLCNLRHFSLDDNDKKDREKQNTALYINVYIQHFLFSSSLNRTSYYIYIENPILYIHFQAQLYAAYSLGHYRDKNIQYRN